LPFHGQYAPHGQAIETPPVARAGGYPFHDATFTVTQCGRICFKSWKVNLSHVFAGQRVGVTQVGERIWLVTFMQYDLGYFDDETCRLEPIDNPFAPKVLPMSSE
jgi:putative transposase